MDEVELEFTDDALLAIAKKAKEKDVGARALRSIIEEFMLDIMYEIPKDGQHRQSNHHQRIHRKDRRPPDPDARIRFTGRPSAGGQRIFLM